ncbi:hypothetical protein MTO96_026562 [Rhipicephalus appendiculatus]
MATSLLQHRRGASQGSRTQASAAEDQRHRRGASQERRARSRMETAHDHHRRDASQGSRARSRVETAHRQHRREASQGSRARSRVAQAAEDQRTLDLVRNVVDCNVSKASRALRRIARPQAPTR